MTTGRARHASLASRARYVDFACVLGALLSFAGCVSGDEHVLSPDGPSATGGAPSLGEEDPLGDDDAGGRPRQGARAPAPARAEGLDDAQHAADARARAKPPTPLPLPLSRTFFGVKSFLGEYRDVYRAIAPFREYRTFVRTLANVPDVDAPELDPLRTRIAEDYPRSHWAFVSGVHELLDFLATRSKDMLQIDKETNVLIRFKTLTFLAGGLDDTLGSGTRYRDYVRELYADVSERHFGRKVKRRGVDEPADEGSETGARRDGAAPGLDDGS